MKNMFIEMNKSLDVVKTGVYKGISYTICKKISKNKTSEKYAVMIMAKNDPDNYNHIINYDYMWIPYKNSAYIIKFESNESVGILLKNVERILNNLFAFNNEGINAYKLIETSNPAMEAFVGKIGDLQNLPNESIRFSINENQHFTTSRVINVDPGDKLIAKTMNSKYVFERVQDVF